MKFYALLALAIGAQALPKGNWNGWSGCLTDAQAQYYVDQSIVFLEHSDVNAAIAAGNAIFDPAIVEFGDSINALRSAPLGTQVENGRATYINETTSQPPIPNVSTLDIVHDCSQIAWHWEFDGIGAQRIRGFTLMKINSEGLIYRQDVEFNSLTWAEDIGFTVSPPTSGPFAAPTGS